MSDIVMAARKTWWEIVEMDGGECGLMAHIRELADEVERLRALTEWRTMESAPRDGTAILACMRGYAPALVQWVEFEGVGRWSVDPEEFPDEDSFRDYWESTRYTPDVWQLLPAPYKAEGSNPSSPSSEAASTPLPSPPVKT